MAGTMEADLSFINLVFSRSCHLAAARNHETYTAANSSPDSSTINSQPT
jgi:hypothetical protein